MIQITDKNGNVLIEPYLAMATANFKSEFNSDFEQTHSLGDAFDFRNTPEGPDFWVLAWNGKKAPTENGPKPTVQAATAARMALEKRMANDINDFEKYGANVTWISIQRDEEGNPVIGVSAPV